MLRLRLALVLTLAAAVAACGGATPSSGVTASLGATAGPGASAEPGATDGSGQPATSEQPAATDEPATGEPEQTDEPAATDEPSPTDEASGSPSADPGAGAAACSGNASNREFFAGVARAVDWPVLCGVLPKGWFVSKGTYRLANGGKLVISYDGPGSASIVLSEGAYCLSDAAACAPVGTEAGAASLGPLGGTLYQTSDGFAIVVAPGENPGWLLTSKGLDQAATVSIGAALAQVAG